MNIAVKNPNAGHVAKAFTALRDAIEHEWPARTDPATGRPDEDREAKKQHLFDNLCQMLGVNLTGEANHNRQMRTIIRRTFKQIDGRLADGE